MWDVIVVGAGISGLTAAQRLSQAGYRVLVLDKSRGLGGRMATRRVSWPQGSGAMVVSETVVDHGCRFIQPPTRLGESWLVDWVAQGVLQPWAPAEFTLEADGQCRPKPSPDAIPGSYTPGSYYVAPQGMNALAKAMAAGLSIQRQSRVTQVIPWADQWRVDWVNESAGSEGAGTDPLAARALVLALPAAQMVPILAPAVAQKAALAPVLAAAEAVTFDPVITVMAGYGPDTPVDLNGSTSAGWMVWGDDHPMLRWVALDSRKRPSPPYAVVVAHSTAAFAQAQFDAEDLAQVGQRMLDQAAQGLGTGLAQPEWVQVHRWRYGFVKQAHPAEVLYTEAVPTLAGCGDWCTGAGVEAAVISGEATARHIIKGLETRD